MTTQANQKAFEEGCTAFLQGKGFLMDCPYETSDSRCSYWLRGWKKMKERKSSFCWGYQ